VLAQFAAGGVASFVIARIEDAPVHWPSPGSSCDGGT